MYFKTMNSFRLFGFKRKSVILRLTEAFFELHSRSYGVKKRQKAGEKERFFSKLKKSK